MRKNKERDDGRLQAQVYLGKKDGKKQYKYVYAKTQRELNKKIEELKVKLGKGIDLSADKDTFDYWGQKWLKLKKSEVSASWYSVLENNYKKLSDIHNASIGKLRLMDLQEILIDLASDGYSKRVIKAVRDIANGVMQIAADNRVIDYNPFTSVKLPKSAKPPEQRRALTQIEQNRIVEMFHRAQLVMMVLLFAGLRRGEMIPLLWSDIDLKAKTITVSKSVEMLKGKPNEKEGGKTYSSSRVIYIPQILVDFLAVQPRKSFLVYPMKTGKMMTASSWKQMFDSYILDMNIKYGEWGNVIPTKYSKKENRPMIIETFTAHCLRHTFITNMYFAGVDILTAKEQAGHSDVKTTLEIYTHLDKTYKKKDMQKYDNFVSACQVPVNENKKDDNSAEK